MRVARGLDEIRRDPRSVVSVGTFDGVHVGHQALARYLAGRARELGGPSVIVTFEPHPRVVLRGEMVPMLTTSQERVQVFEGLGIDQLVVLRFTRSFSQLTPRAFIKDVLVDRVGLREMVVGHDHSFGKGRSGNQETLEELSLEFDFGVHVFPAQALDVGVVSSTAIRTLLGDEGDVETAARMLGRPYALAGTVVHGRERGRSIGYPTANLEVDASRKVIPARGVYAVRVAGAAEGAVHDGMMNVGFRPTFNHTPELTLEVHLLDFSGDLYGERLEVSFVARIRDERQFDSVEALVEQLRRDHERTSQVLGAARQGSAAATGRSLL